MKSTGLPKLKRSISAVEEFGRATVAPGRPLVAYTALAAINIGIVLPPGQAGIIWLRIENASFKTLKSAPCFTLTGISY